MRRLLLLVAVLTGWAFLIGILAGVPAPLLARSRPLSAARVIVPGTDDVLALQQVADEAVAEADAKNPRNLVFTADHSVYAPVGDYSDCTGKAPLTHAAAAVDTCITGVTYFIGHNPGVFSGLMDARIGSVIGYFDARGHLNQFEVVAVRTWLRSAGVPPPLREGEAAQFQTCVTADGSVDRILDAVAI